MVGVPITTDTSLPAAVVVRRPNSELTERDVYDAIAGLIAGFHGMERIKRSLSPLHISFEKSLPAVQDSAVEFIWSIHSQKHTQENRSAAKSPKWQPKYLSRLRTWIQIFSHTFRTSQSNTGN